MRNYNFSVAFNERHSHMCVWVLVGCYDTLVSVRRSFLWFLKMLCMPLNIIASHNYKSESCTPAIIISKMLHPPTHTHTQAHVSFIHSLALVPVTSTKKIAFIVQFNFITILATEMNINMRTVDDDGKRCWFNQMNTSSAHAHDALTAQPKYAYNQYLACSLRPVSLSLSRISFIFHAERQILVLAKNKRALWNKEFRVAGVVFVVGFEFIYYPKSEKR